MMVKTAISCKKKCKNQLENTESVPLGIKKEFFKIYLNFKMKAKLNQSKIML